jgi:3-oxoacyl-[acyl-carrier-protein] synthase-3
MSSVTNWEDRTTCVLFGDGAGAAVMQSLPEGRGIIASDMGSDGSLSELLYIPAGGVRLPASHRTVDERLHFIRMGGNKVFKRAVTCMSDSCMAALERAGLTTEQVDWVIPHQANMRIIKAIAARIGVPMERVCVNLDRVGNMSAASVPVVLDEAVRDGRIKKGDIIVFTVFGGGFTWGSTVMEW